MEGLPNAIAVHGASARALTVLSDTVCRLGVEGPGTGSKSHLGKNNGKIGTGLSGVAAESKQQIQEGAEVRNLRASV